jgi:hypothetical protein
MRFASSSFGLLREFDEAKAGSQGIKPWIPRNGRGTQKSSVDRSGES